MSADNSKVSFVLTLRRNCPDLTCEMMSSIDAPVDEIVRTRDDAVMYVYIHLLCKMRKDALEKAMKKLLDKGVHGTIIFGYNEIDGTSHASSELIEDHPCFKTLVRHQEEDNPNFHRWTAADYGTNSGYNKLKNKLLSRRTSSPGQAADGGGGGDGGYGEGARNDDDKEHVPHPRPSESDGKESKRQKTETSDGGGENYFFVITSPRNRRRRGHQRRRSGRKLRPRWIRI
jgi:hypothetical protein